MDCEVGCPINHLFELGFCSFAQSWVWTQILLLGGHPFLEIQRKFLKYKGKSISILFGSSFFNYISYQFNSWTGDLHFSYSF